MNKWYKFSSAFGTDPFGSGELSLKTTTSPYGEAGGDVHDGIFSPSDSTKNHHPSDSFSEQGHQDLTEEQLEKIKKKKKIRKKILMKKIKDNLERNSSKESWYKVASKPLLFIRDTKDPEGDVKRNFSCYSGSWVDSEEEALNMQHESSALTSPKQDPKTGLWCYDPEFGLSGYCVLDENNYEKAIHSLYSSHGYVGGKLAVFASSNYYLGGGADGEDVFSDANFLGWVDDSLGFEEFKKLASNKINKTAQWGSLGPVLPTFSADDWLVKSYEKVKNIQDKSQPQIPNKKKFKKKKMKEKSSLLSVEPDENIKALAVNERIVVTASKLVKNQTKIKIGDKIYNGSLLVSNRGLTAIALSNTIEGFSESGDFSHVEFGKDIEVPLDYIKSWLKNNNIICRI